LLALKKKLKNESDSGSMVFQTDGGGGAMRFSGERVRLPADDPIE
jgi:hypothetical protein